MAITSVYVSSTFEDLKSYRSAVASYLRKLNKQVIGMEDYVACDTRPLAKCLEDVANADVYVGIFAHRYGYIPIERDNPDSLSVTELEYRQAVKCGKPALIFLLSEQTPWFREYMDEVTGKAGSGNRIKTLREELSKDKLASFFSGELELAGLVSAAVANLEATKSRPVAAAAARSAPPERRIRAALPEFMIRLSRNQPQDSKSWNKVRDDEFRRNYELAADPVFDITVENKSSNTIVLYTVGIRILQRIAGTGGTMGYSQPVKVQSEFRVHCPQEWKQTWGSIDDKSETEFVDPIEMKKGNSAFRFSLMLENFCDVDSASSCEVRFYLVTGNGTAESRSIWLSQ